MKKAKKSLIALIALIFIFSVMSFPILAQDSELVMLDEPGGSDYVPIVIDGSFSDWSDKPMSSIFYGQSAVHTGSLYRDEEYVYLYIRMADTGYSQFNGYNYIFNVDGKTYTFDIISASGGYQTGSNVLQVFRTNGYKIVSGASGYMVRSDGQPDEMEMRIPLTYFFRQPEMLVTITFTSPNLGTQVLTATGVSTMPVIFAVSGLLAVSAVFLVRKRKQIV